MSVQQQLLDRLGDKLVFQFQESIEAVRASGRTSESIHRVSSDFEVEVLAAPNIWTIEDGRKPTGQGAGRGNPTLFEQIKEWAKIRGIVSDLNDRKQLSVVYAITQKIHKEGWKPTLDKPLTKVLESIDPDDLLRELIAHQATVYSDRIFESAKEFA